MLHETQFFSFKCKGKLLFEQWNVFNDSQSVFELGEDIFRKLWAFFFVLFCLILSYLLFKKNNLLFLGVKILNNPIIVIHVTSYYQLQLFHWWTWTHFSSPAFCFSWKKKNKKTIQPFGEINYNRGFFLEE